MLNIAIIECGIVGPAAALFLRRLQAKVTIFDKVADLQPVGAGILLQPAGLNVLSQLGLIDGLLKKGVPISGLVGKNHRDKVVLNLHYKDLVPYHLGLGIHRAALYEALYNALISNGVNVLNPCEIMSIDNQADHVVLHDKNGTGHGPYDCVIIADGAHSKLRSALKIKVKVKPYQWGALWAIAEDKTQQFGHLLEQVYKNTEIMAGILPMGWNDQHMLVSFFWSMHQSQLANWRSTPIQQWKEQVIKIWPQLTSILSQFTSHGDFSFATYSDVKTKPWHDNRVVIIGDAAHGMSPQLGQGANLGLIDAMILSECISAFPLPQALAEYSKRRKLQLRYYQQASRFVTPWFQSSHPLMGYLRDIMHAWFCATPIIRHQMLLTLACMKTGYFKAQPLNQFEALSKLSNIDKL